MFRNPISKGQRFLLCFSNTRVSTNALIHVFSSFGFETLLSHLLSDGVTDTILCNFPNSFRMMNQNSPHTTLFRVTPVLESFQGV
ncbi:hypothetical protein VNO80_25523 [Phaseolus coccineus]|uniref:Uncharacterized protein n=1 Tax=Phaseolus coccineus TaxID=3886 RepID=A0AAN9LYS8_PHACN